LGKLWLNKDVEKLDIFTQIILLKIVIYIEKFREFAVRELINAMLTFYSEIT